MASERSRVSGTTRRVRVLGVGMGPQHVTPEVSAALLTTAYVVAASKSEDDPLLDVRREICAAHGVPLVAVPDPARDRSPTDYDRAVADWHEARVSAYADQLRARPGDVAFLVWGDPSLYDSTVRVVSSLAERLELDWDVLPGVSAPSLLAARHRIVLHEVGRPVHVTTARRLREAVDRGEDNVVVMLGTAADLGSWGAELADWSLWWGANLGAPGERLVAGRVADVLDEVLAAREQARAASGWVMDVSLLRRSRA